MLRNRSFLFADKVVKEPLARDPHHPSLIQFSEEALLELSLLMNERHEAIINYKLIRLLKCSLVIFNVFTILYIFIYYHLYHLYLDYSCELLFFTQ